MKSLNLNEAEKLQDVEQMVRAIAGEARELEWTCLFSAHGKHQFEVRKDPAEIDD